LHDWESFDSMWVFLHITCIITIVTSGAWNLHEHTRH